MVQVQLPSCDKNMPFTSVEDPHICFERESAAASGLHVFAIVASAETPDHCHSELPLRKTRKHLCCLRVFPHVHVACQSVDVQISW